jgi:hypothetical protein
MPEMSNFSRKVGDVEMSAQSHADGSITVRGKDVTGKPLTPDRMEAYVSSGDDGSFVVTVKPKGS